MREKLNCPNCGAPITDYKCAYCGTLFYDFANIEAMKQSYIRFRYNDQLIIMKAVPKSIDFSFIEGNFPELNIIFSVLEGRKIKSNDAKKDEKIGVEQK